MKVVNRRQPNPCPAPGQYPNIAPAEYHLWNACNASLLKECATGRSMAQWLNGEPIQATYSMIYGTALEEALLRPERYAKNKVVVGGLRPQAKSETFAKAAKDNPGKIILAEEVWEDAIAGTVGFAKTLADVREALWGGTTKSCATPTVLQDKATGLRCKFMLDRVSVDKDGFYFLTDIKSTAADDPQKFQRQIWDLGYDIQLAFYRRMLCQLAGITPDRVRCQIVVCQNSGDYDVWLHDMGEKWMELGTARMEARISHFAHALAHDKWLGWGNDNGMVYIDPEKWMYSQWCGGEV
jgi:hypothetical protein